MTSCKHFLRDIDFYLPSIVRHIFMKLDLQVRLKLCAEMLFLRQFISIACWQEDGLFGLIVLAYL